jgi:S1-C subfamily serine protease
MKIRSVILIVLLVGGFVYLTSYSNFRGLPSAPLAKLWRDSPMHLTEAEAQPAYTQEEANRIAVYKRTLPSVVNVTSSALAFDFFYGVVPQSGQGSGFVLTKDGRIITNYHVIQNAQNVEVTTSDKHTYKAQIILQDKAHDLALLQINAKNLTPSILSESSDLQVGQNVYAIGNPFGLNGTMNRKAPPSTRLCKPMPPSIPAIPAAPCSTRAVK